MKLLKFGIRTALRKRFALWKTATSPRTLLTLANDLRCLGIGQGDTVLVHSAFSKIGYVKGGCATFIAALRDTVGPDGNIVMPSYPFNDAMADYVGTNPTFDVVLTPSKSGALTECFRTRPGTLRSLHPTHSFCASGPQAKWITEDHSNCVDPFGLDSPVYRAVKLKAKCLLISVGFRSCTPLSILESAHRYPYNVWQPDLAHLIVIDHYADRRVIATRVHQRERAVIRDPECYRQPLIDRQKLWSGRIGQAHTTVVDCDGMMEFLLEQINLGVVPYPVAQLSNVVPRQRTVTLAPGVEINR